MEQFEQLPGDGTRHELDQGELIAAPPPSLLHGTIQSCFVRLIPASAGLTVTGVGFYLSAETLVYPDEQSVHIFESSHQGRILEAADLLEAPDLLPGFSVRVADLFA